MLFAIIFKFSDCFGSQIDRNAYNIKDLIYIQSEVCEWEEPKALKTKRPY